MIRRLLLFLVLASPCFGATPTVVQKAATTAVSTSVATASLTTHTGNSVAVACGCGTASQTFSVTDGTNTYTPVGTSNTTQASEGDMRWFVAKNITGVTHTIACSSAANVFRNIFVYELSGASTTSPVDVPSTTSGASGASSAAPSFTLPATTFANDLLLFAASCGNTCSAGAGADVGNSQSDGSGDESETFAKSAIGTYSGAFSQTAGAFIVIGVAITDGVSASAGPNVGFKGKVGFVGKVGIL